ELDVNIKFVYTSLVLQALWRHIANTDFPIALRLNLDPLCRQSQYSGLDRIYVGTPRNSLPPDHPVSWLQHCMFRGSFQHSCHLPSTRYTRPSQDQTLPVYFPGKIRHGRHVLTMGTRDVVEDTLLEMWRDSVPE